MTIEEPELMMLNAELPSLTTIRRQTKREKRTSTMQRSVAQISLTIIMAEVT